MATYTVTRVITRPNTSTQWPHEVSPGGYVDLKSSGKVTISTSTDSDNLVQTSSYIWASKADYINNLPSEDNPAPNWLKRRNEYNTYMSSNNITGRITGEDGTVKVFNSSNNTWEVEQKLK